MIGLLLIIQKNFTILSIKKDDNQTVRFKVYIDYKLKLKAYSKRFDPFVDGKEYKYLIKDNFFIQTTIGQLNFFRWVLEMKF